MRPPASPTRASGIKEPRPSRQTCPRADDESSRCRTLKHNGGPKVFAHLGTEILGLMLDIGRRELGFSSRLVA